MAATFRENWYLRSKLEQCEEIGQTDTLGKAYTATSLAKAIASAGFTLEDHYHRYSDIEGTSAYTDSGFSENYYLASKLAQLRANNLSYTKEQVIEAIQNIGLTVEEHFQKYSLVEGTSPGPYFNTLEYLHAKLAQLKNNSNEQIANEWADKTLDDLVQALKEANLSPEEHYYRYGSWETDKDGNLINPSNAFDANAYASAKLAQLQASDPEHWTGKTGVDVIKALFAAHMTPISHYQLYGADEANAWGIAFVQTVPVIDRVPNDPLRDSMGENVPANYNESSPAPRDVSVGNAVIKPADMGNLADPSISPTVVSPEDPIPTPTDINFVPIPTGVLDTNENPIVRLDIRIEDAEGNTVVVSQFGVCVTEDGRVKIHAIDSNGISQTILQETTTDPNGNPTTILHLADADGNVTQVTTTSGNQTTTVITGTLRDGSTFVSQSTGDGTSVHTQSTLTAKDGSSVYRTSDTAILANGATETTTKSVSYAKNGSIVQTVTSTTKITPNSNGSTTTHIDTVTKDASGNVIETRSETHTVSLTADGGTRTISKISEEDAQGYTTRTETSSVGYRNPDGSITTTTEGNSVTTNPQGDIVTTEVLSKTVTVLPDGSVVTTALLESSAADGSTTTTHQRTESTIDADGTARTWTRTETHERDSQGNEIAKTTTDEQSTQNADGSKQSVKVEERENADGSKEKTETESQTSADGVTKETTKTTETDIHGNQTSTTTTSNNEQGDATTTTPTTQTDSSTSNSSGNGTRTSNTTTNTSGQGNSGQRDSTNQSSQSNQNSSTNQTDPTDSSATDSEQGNSNQNDSGNQGTQDSQGGQDDPSNPTDQNDSSNQEGQGSQDTQGGQDDPSNPTDQNDPADKDPDQGNSNQNDSGNQGEQSGQDGQGGQDSQGGQSGQDSQSGQNDPTNQGGQGGQDSQGGQDDPTNQGGQSGQDSQSGQNDPTNQGGQGGQDSQGGQDDSTNPTDQNDPADKDPGQGNTNQNDSGNQGEQSGQDDPSSQGGQDSQTGQGGQDDPSNQGGQDNQGGQGGQNDPTNQGGQGGQDDPSNQGGQDNQGGQGGQDDPTNQGGQDSQGSQDDPSNQGGQDDPTNQGGQGGQDDPSNQGSQDNQSGQGGQDDPSNQGGQGGQDDPTNQDPEQGNQNESASLPDVAGAMTLQIAQDGTMQYIKGASTKSLDLGSQHDGTQMVVTLTNAQGATTTYTATYAEGSKWEASEENPAFQITKDGAISLSGLRVGSYAVDVALRSPETLEDLTLGSSQALSVNAAELSVPETIRDATREITGNLTLWGNLDPNETLTLAVHEGTAESSLVLAFDPVLGWTTDMSTPGKSDLGALTFEDGILSLARTSGVRDGLANTYTFTASVGSFTNSLLSPITTVPTEAHIELGDAAAPVTEALIPQIGSLGGNATDDVTTTGSLHISGDFACIQLPDVDETQLTPEDLAALATQPKSVLLANGNTLTLTGFAEDTLSYQYTLAHPLNGADAETLSITLVAANGSTQHVDVTIPVLDDTATLADVTISYADDNSLVLTLKDPVLGADADGAVLTARVGEEEISYTYSVDQNTWSPSKPSTHFTFDPETKTLRFSDPSLAADTKLPVSVTLHDGDTKPTDESTGAISFDAITINPSDNPKDSHPTGTMHFTLAEADGKSVITGKFADTFSLGADAEGSLLTLHMTNTAGAEQDFTARYGAATGWMASEGSSADFSIGNNGDICLQNLPVGSYTIAAMIRDSDDTQAYALGTSETLTIPAAKIDFPARVNDAEAAISGKLALSPNLAQSDRITLTVEENGVESTLTLFCNTADAGGWTVAEDGEKKTDLGELTFANGLLTLNRAQGVHDGQANTYTFSATVGTFTSPMGEPLTTSVIDPLLAEGEKPTPVQESMIPGKGSSQEAGDAAVSTQGTLTLSADVTQLRVGDTVIEDLTNGLPATITLPSSNTLTLTELDGTTLTYTYTLTEPLNNASEDSFVITARTADGTEESLTITIPVEDDSAHLGGISTSYNAANELVLSLNDFTTGADADGATLNVTLGSSTTTFTYDAESDTWIKAPDDAPINFDPVAKTLTVSDPNAGVDAVKEISITVRDGDCNSANETSPIQTSVTLNPRDNPNDFHPTGEIAFSLAKDGGKTNIQGTWVTKLALGDDAEGSVLTVNITSATEGNTSYTATYADGSWTTSDPKLFVDAEGNITLSDLHVGTYSVGVELKDKDDTIARTLGTSDPLTIAAATLTQDAPFIKDSAPEISGSFTLSENLAENEIVLLSVQEEQNGEIRESTLHVRVNAGLCEVVDGEEKNELGILRYENGNLILTRADGVNDGQANTYTFTSKVGDFVSLLTDPIETHIANVALKAGTEPSSVKESMIPTIGSEAGNAEEFPTTNGTLEISGELKAITIHGTTLEVSDLQELANSEKTIELDSGNTLTLTKYENGILSYSYALLHALQQKNADSFTITALDAEEMEASLEVRIPVEDDTATLTSASLDYSENNDLRIHLQDMSLGADALGAQLTISIGEDHATFTFDESGWHCDAPEKFSIDATNTITYKNGNLDTNTKENIKISLRDGDYDAESGDGPAGEIEFSDVLLNSSPNIVFEKTSFELAENSEHNGSVENSASFKNVKNGDTIVIEEKDVTEAKKICIAISDLVSGQNNTIQEKIEDEIGSLSITGCTYQDNELTLNYTYTQKENTANDHQKSFNISVEDAYGKSLCQGDSISYAIKDSKPSAEGITVEYSETDEAIRLNIPSEKLGADNGNGATITATITSDLLSEDIVLTSEKINTAWVSSINGNKINTEDNPYGTLSYDGSRLTYIPNKTILTGNYNINVVLTDADSSTESTDLQLSVVKEGTSKHWSVASNVLEYTGDKLDKSTDIAIIVQENRAVSVDGATNYESVVNTINLNNQKLSANANVQIYAGKNASIGEENNAFTIKVGSYRPGSTTVSLTEEKVDNINIQDDGNSTTKVTLVGDLEINDKIEGTFIYKDLNITKGGIQKISEGNLYLHSSAGNVLSGSIAESISGIEKLTFDSITRTSLENLDFSGIENIYIKSSGHIDISSSQFSSIKTLEGENLGNRIYVHEDNNTNNLTSELVFQDGTYNLGTKVTLMTAEKPSIIVQGENTKVDIRSISFNERNGTLVMNKDGYAQQITLNGLSYNKLSDLESDCQEDTINIIYDQGTTINGNILDKQAATVTLDKVMDLKITAADIDISNIVFTNFKKIVLDDDKTHTLKISGDTLGYFKETMYTKDYGGDTIEITTAIGTSEENMYELETTNDNAGTKKSHLNQYKLASTEDGAGNFVKVTDGNLSVKINTNIHLIAGDNGDTFQGGKSINLFTLGDGNDKILSTVSSSEDLDIITNFSTGHDIFKYKGNISGSINSENVLEGNSLAELLSGDKQGLVYVINNDTGLGNTITSFEGLFNNLTRNEFSSAKSTAISDAKGYIISAVNDDISNIDSVLTSTKTVLLAINDGSNAIISLLKNSSTGDNSIADSEIEIVGILKNGNIHAGDFYEDPE